MMKLLFAKGYMLASTLSIGVMKASKTGYEALNEGGSNVEGLNGLVTGIGQDVMSIVRNVGLILAAIFFAIGGLALIWNNKQAMERQNQKNGFLSIVAGIMFIIGAVTFVGWIVGIINSAISSGTGATPAKGKAIVTAFNMVTNLLR